MSATFTTNVPQPSLGANGFIAPTQSQILAGVQADINQAFGGNVNFGTANGSTPAGQFSTSLAATIGNTYDLMLSIFNGVNPAFATGMMQDAIGNIYFMTRSPGTSTVTQVTCSGLAGVQIPLQAVLQAEDGNLYTCDEAGTIPISGSIVLPFSCEVQGPISCPAQTFSIYQAIGGWDSAISSNSGIEGTNVQTAASFEQQRQASVESNSQAMLASIRGSVLNVPNVIDVYTTENDNLYPISLNPVAVIVGSVSGTTLTVASVISGTVATTQGVALALSTIAGVTLSTGITISSGSGSTWTLSGSCTIPTGTTINLGGVVINPKSIYAAVAGGDALAVATAIWSKKNPGCGYTGNTTETVYDTSPPYGSPGRPYSVTFEIPADVDIYFNVPISTSGAVQSNATTLIQNAILNAFTGGDGGLPAQIGTQVWASRYYAGITNLGEWAQLEPIGLATSNDTPIAVFVGSITNATLTVASFTSGSGSLAANQVLQGTGVAVGTFILSQIGGTPGETGTYLVSIAQAVTTGTTFDAIPVASSSFTMNIAQVPVTTAANINVTFP